VFEDEQENMLENWGWLTKSNLRRKTTKQELLDFPEVA